MRRASGWCVLVVILSAAVLWAAEDAVTALGVTKGEPINKCFVFIDGKYIDPPYVVERRGVDIYINDTLFEKGLEWPPYDYRVATDPGDPPAGTSPLDRIPPGVDGRSTYWGLKTRYLFQHYDEETARQTLLALYRKCSTIASVDWDPTNPTFVKLTDQSGEITLLELSVYPERMVAPPTNEQITASREWTRKTIESILSNDGCVFRFAGGEVFMPKQTGLKALGVLLSSQTPEEKAKALSGGDIGISKSLAGRTVKGFQANAQLLERYQAAVKALAPVESTGQ